MNEGFVYSPVVGAKRLYDLYGRIPEFSQSAVEGLKLGTNYLMGKPLPAPAAEPVANTAQAVPAPQAPTPTPDQVALTMAQTGQPPQATTADQIALNTAMNGIAPAQAAATAPAAAQATPEQPAGFWGNLWDKTKKFAATPAGARTIAGLGVGLGGMAFGGRPVEGLAYGLGAAGATAEKQRKQAVEDKKLENEEKRLDDNALYRAMLINQRSDLANQRFQNAKDLIDYRGNTPLNLARVRKAEADAAMYELAIQGDPRGLAYFQNQTGLPATPAQPAPANPIMERGQQIVAQRQDPLGVRLK